MLQRRDASGPTGRAARARRWRRRRTCPSGPHKVDERANLQPAPRRLRGERVACCSCARALAPRLNWSAPKRASSTCDDGDRSCSKTRCRSAPLTSPGREPSHCFHQHHLGGKSGPSTVALRVPGGHDGDEWMPEAGARDREARAGVARCQFHHRLLWTQRAARLCLLDHLPSAGPVLLGAPGFMYSSFSARMVPSEAKVAAQARERDARRPVDRVHRRRQHRRRRRERSADHLLDVFPASTALVR